MLLNDSSFFLSFLGEVGRDLWLPLKAKKKKHTGDTSSCPASRLKISQATFFCKLSLLKANFCEIVQAVFMFLDLD